MGISELRQTYPFQDAADVDAAGVESDLVRQGVLNVRDAILARQMHRHCDAGMDRILVAEGLVTRGDLLRAREWFGQGYDMALKTPDNTLVFVTPEEKQVIRKDQADCMGCLSHCGFSSWKDHDDYSTGYLADPRSFCIQKTLQDIAHGGDPEQNLMFSGHNAYRFGQDPFYSNGFVPTVKQLVDRILTGD